MTNTNADRLGKPFPCPDYFCPRQGPGAFFMPRKGVFPKCIPDLFIRSSRWGWVDGPGTPLGRVPARLPPALRLLSQPRHLGDDRRHANRARSAGAQAVPLPQLLSEIGRRRDLFGRRTAHAARFPAGLPAAVPRSRHPHLHRHCGRGAGRLRGHPPVHRPGALRCQTPRPGGL